MRHKPKGRKSPYLRLSKKHRKMRLQKVYLEHWISWHTRMKPGDIITWQECHKIHPMLQKRMINKHEKGKKS